MFKWMINKSLFGAIRNRDYDTVRLALAKGANPNTHNYGITPLMRACLTGDDVIIGILIEAGADPEVKDKQGRVNVYEFCKENGVEHKIEHIKTCWSTKQAMLKMGVE